MAQGQRKWHVVSNGNSVTRAQYQLILAHEPYHRALVEKYEPKGMFS